MNKLVEVINCIRLCRNADIDVKITINKSVSHLFLNALEKRISKRPINMTCVEFTGCTDPQFKSGEYPSCKAHADTDDDAKVCYEYGQMLDCGGIE